MPQWLIPAITFFCGCVATYVILRIRFERFEAAYIESNKARQEWRDSVELRLSKLNGALLERIDRIEEEIGDHDHGMRGTLHTHGDFIHYHGQCLWLVARKNDLPLPPMEKRRER